MRKMKNKKLKAILSISGYFLLVLALCFVGALVFHSYYYELVYVSGISMAPTLNGADNERAGSIVDFGIVDKHKSALDHIDRFDIVSTYYPYSEKYKSDYTPEGVLKAGAKMKIKRVIGMPGDVFEIKDGLLYLQKGEEFINVKYPFKMNLSESHLHDKDTNTPITLGENEYWLLGDNRNSSNDSASMGTAIKKENIVGVLVAIEGRAQLSIKNYVCLECGRRFTSNGTCNYDGGALEPEYKLINKQYQWPKYF